MTTGSRTIGDGNSKYFFTKSWTGTNGKGLNPVSLQWNPYTMYTSTVQQDFEACYGRTVFNSGHYYYWLLPDLAQFSANDSINLIQKLTTQVKGHSFNMAVTAGEGKETIKLVVNTLSRIRKAVKSVKRGDISAALRTLGTSVKPEKHKDSKYLTIDRSGKLIRRKHQRNQLATTDVSAIWLEIQYGWKPLINDVYEACNAYSALQKERPRKQTYHASISKSVVRSQKYLDVYGRFLFTHTSSHVIKRKLTVEIIEDISKARSIGLLDPLPVVWELVPFSFVADWFIPIGDYFEARSILPGINGRFLQSDIDIRKTNCAGNPLFNAELFWDGLQCGYNDRRDFKGSTYDGSSYKITRSLPGNLTVPLPVFKGFEKAFSTDHIKNGIALLHQLVS